MKIYLSLIVVFTCLFGTIGALSGCDYRTQEQINKDQSNFIAQYLPYDANEVKYLGNDWYTFELESDGLTRKFLHYRAWTADRGYCSTVDITPPDRLASQAR